MLAAKRLILPLAIGAPCDDSTCCWPEERLGRDCPDMETPTCGVGVGVWVGVGARLREARLH